MAALQKVAVVTGAGTGIGKAVALSLMKEGYATVFAGRRKDKLEEAASEGKSSGAKSLVVPTDVSDPAAIKALFAKTKETFGRLDVLFNNAGIGAPAVPLEDLPYETWKQVVDTNLTGMFLCTQEAIKIMKAQDPRGGRIICCGQIDIGNAATPLTERMVQGQGVMQADGRMAIEARMNADDVGRAVVYIVNLPLDTNVLFLTVMANLMPFVGRG